MRLFVLVILLLCAVPRSASAGPQILGMRERAEVIDRWLEIRLKSVLPPLMRREGIDMWVLISREYNEDPVLETFLPATWPTARRRTILLIFDPGDGKPLETLAVARYGVGRAFQKAWDKEKHGSQWQRLAALIEARDPKTIAIDVSETLGLADGLPHTEHQLFREALAPALRDRIVSAEKLALGWLETRTEAEMTVYPQIVRIAHEVIADGLSESVIQPGITTTNDVEWWYRDRIRELRLTAWFHPSVSIQRAEQPELDHKAMIEAHHDDAVIRPGDLLHVDFGLTYLRLHTDTQQHAYVLKRGETEVPADLARAFARGNRLQDILIDNFVAGRTGNQILAATHAQAKKEGIKASIYTHPIGYHGHGAGPTIGLWDQQQGVPGAGDYPLHPNTAYAIELYAESDVPSWGRSVRIQLEEDAFFDGERTTYIDGRQKAIFTLPRRPPTP